MLHLRIMKFLNSDLRVNSFPEMGLNAELMTALETMKITQPTPIQCQAIATAKTGVDIVAVAQTGSGKTLAYALPILQAMSERPEARALVLAPSREMAEQIFRVFETLTAELPMTASLIIGGLSSSLQTSKLKKNPRIIVATPGRLYDHLLTNKLLLKNTQFLVIDEADRMLDMGFAPQLKNIHGTMRGEWQTLMFSASFRASVETVAQIFMRPEPTMIRTEMAEAPVENLRQRVIFLDRNRKNEQLFTELGKTKGGVIVFVGDKERCEIVGQFLKDNGYSTDLIHGELSAGHRGRVIREFREGQIRIIVTTDLLARGLDVPHVDNIISVDLPFEPEDFLHRIGRTARAGRSGTAVTFVTPVDGRKYKMIRKYLDGADEVKADPYFEFVEPRTDRYRKPDADTKKVAKAPSPGFGPAPSRPVIASGPAGGPSAGPRPTGRPQGLGANAVPRSGPRPSRPSSGGSRPGSKPGEPKSR